ncbi:MAG TPA: arginine deiminase family protein [Steroidobacteraceae bacterium]|jgi:dimethylargininase|nr:arginine deiminase family protein [Steroidobacteraceae bacterium]
MRFSNAIVRLPGPNFSEGLTTSTRKRVPESAKALQQHAAYCSALQACGLHVTVMEADLQYPDGTFVEDTFVIAERVAIAMRPGAKTRIGEVASVAATLRRFTPRWEQIEAPGTVDGGDICQADEHFLIGLSARTNEAGAAQLTAILARHHYTASTVDIRGHASLLHLKSGIAYLGARRFLVVHGFPAIDAMADADRIEVAQSDAYAANCIRVNDHVLIAAGFPQVAAALKEQGLGSLTLEMSEFAKMDGGLSCLSLRF